MGLLTRSSQQRSTTQSSKSWHPRADDINKPVQFELVALRWHLSQLEYSDGDSDSDSDNEVMYENAKVSFENGWTHTRDPKGPHLTGSSKPVSRLASRPPPIFTWYNITGPCHRPCVTVFSPSNEKPNPTRNRRGSHRKKKKRPRPPFQNYANSAALFPVPTGFLAGTSAACTTEGDTLLPIFDGSGDDPGDTEG